MSQLTSFIAIFILAQIRHLYSLLLVSCCNYLILLLLISLLDFFNLLTSFILLVLYSLRQLNFLLSFLKLSLSFPLLFRILLSSSFSPLYFLDPFSVCPWLQQTLFLDLLVNERLIRQYELFGDLDFIMLDLVADFSQFFPIDIFQGITLS